MRVFICDVFSSSSPCFTELPILRNKPWIMCHNSPHIGSLPDMLWRTNTDDKGIKEICKETQNIFHYAYTA